MIFYICETFINRNIAHKVKEEYTETNTKKSPASVQEIFRVSVEYP